MNVMSKITLYNLRRNKKRTVVTVIGVILSAAMITAVATLCESFVNTMLTESQQRYGYWEAELKEGEYGRAESLEERSDLEEVLYKRSVGFSPLRDGQNEYKPYLYVEECTPQALARYPYRILEGRLPENDQELLISNHLISDGGVAWKVGDTVTLPLGQRERSGERLTNEDGFYKDYPEVWTQEQERTYTIVGIMARPGSENIMSPGYTAVSYLDMGTVQEQDMMNVGLIFKNPTRTLFSTCDELKQDLGFLKLTTNDDVLRYMGLNSRDGFYSVLYGMATILFALIIIGSISLIYNAFAISVSERSKQFGMLKSVGATQKQVLRTVLFEGLVISGIGVPLGILAGIAGIAVTLHLLAPFMSSILKYVDAIHLHVSVQAVVLAAVLGIATVLISAVIPARRAARMSAIEAIRQVKDVSIKGKQVQTSRLSRRIFGMEGVLALKNLKRSRKKYRTTIFSLFISIVLFIGVSTFTEYMKSSTQVVYSVDNYKLSLHLSSSKETEQARNMSEKLGEIQGIDRWSLVRNMYLFAEIPKASISTKYLQNSGPLEGEDPDFLQISIPGVSVGDAEFERFARELGLDPLEYEDLQNPKAILLNEQLLFPENETPGLYEFLATLPSSPVTLQEDGIEGESTSAEASITIGTKTETAPTGVSSQRIAMVVSDSIFDAYLQKQFPSEESTGSRLYINTVEENPASVIPSVQDLINQYLPVGRADELYNRYEVDQSNRNLLIMISVFSYGFIALITLISVANIFNTISTNMNLRRREFAMLRSVGMTPKSFNRMIYFESLFYGLKALLYGLPAALLLSVLMAMSIASGITGIGVLIPWAHVGICIAGVLLIVFVTMMYSMAKIKKENIMDGLRVEAL